MAYKHVTKNKKVLFQCWLDPEYKDLPKLLKIKALRENKTRDNLMTEILLNATKGVK